MCFICTLLDKSFPEPKQLAKAYFETTLTGVDTKDHYETVEAKMEEHINAKQMSQKEVEAYHAEFKAEYYRLNGLGWTE
jgi:hypothetical protein